MTHRTNLYASSLALYSLMVTAAYAESDEWWILMEQGNYLRHSGDDRGAIAKYREALRVAEQKGNAPLSVASSLNGLGLANDSLGRIVEAENDYRRALTIAKQAAGEPSVSSAQIMVNLSGSYLRKGQVAEAESLLREAIGAYTKLGTPDRLKMAIARSCLSEVLLQKKEFEEAERLGFQAMEVFEKETDLVDGQLAAGFNNLGVLRHYQGRDAEATQYLERSVETSSASVGRNHPTLIKPLANLGTLYSLGGRNKDADAVFQRALKIAESTYGSSHPVYATVLMNYAACIRKDGRKGEAKKLESKATTVLKDTARANGTGMTVDVSSFRLR